MNTTIKTLLSGCLALFATTATMTLSASAQTSGTQTTPPEEFKPSGRFSMQFFGDYSYQIGADTAASRSSLYYSSNKKDAQMFDIRRVYLGYDYSFTKNISAQLLLSHENGNATSGDVVLDANRGLFIKAANIRWKNAIPNSTLIFGQQGTPALALAEQVWGYRSIEKTSADLRGFVQSNDLGIQLNGGFDQASTVGYSLMISNGNGAKAENNKYKKIAGELNGKLLDNKLVLEVYGDRMDLSPTQAQTTIKGLAGLMMDMFSVGVEYTMQTQTKENADDVTPNMLSIFARGTIIEKELNAFARFDMFDPNSKTSNVNFKQNFITAGLDWIPNAEANVHVMPNVWINSYSDKSSADLKVDADVIGRITFFFKF